MKLCEEIKQWSLLMPNQQRMLPFMSFSQTKKTRPKSRRKKKPPDPEKVTITVSDTGERTVAVERMVPKRKQVQRKLSRDADGEAEAQGNEKYQHMSTQTALHDLEFLITDPLIHETRIRRARTSLPREVVYTRAATSQRTYRTDKTVLNVEHQTIDNITVHIEKQSAAKEDEKQGYQETGKEKVNDEGKEKSSKQGKKISFSEDSSDEQKVVEKPDNPKNVRIPSKVAKPSEHKLPMVRVGGGWMELPDYLRFHVPMHVHAEGPKDGQEGNMVIRSQRPRSQMFNKKGESPSWTATLSRGSKGSASTIMRQRLV